MRKPNVKAMQAECDRFNAICPVGGKVSVKLDNVAEPFETTTRSEAQILSGHTPVIWMHNVSGCYLLDRIDHAVMASDGGQLNPAWVEWLMGWPGSKSGSNSIQYIVRNEMTYLRRPRKDGDTKPPVPPKPSDTGSKK